MFLRNLTVEFTLVWGLLLSSFCYGLPNLQIQQLKQESTSEYQVHRADGTARSVEVATDYGGGALLPRAVAVVSLYPCTSNTLHPNFTSIDIF